MLLFSFSELLKLRRAVDWVERVDPSAADSLWEEMLTVVNLGVLEELCKTL